MRKTDNNPRRNFLKRIPGAIVSISAFSFFKFKKSKNYSEKKFDILSKSEADQIIKNNKFPVTAQHTPAPAPVKQKNRNG